MISRPDFVHHYEQSVIRRDIIKTSYNKALANGDKNVYFIDGETLMNEKDGTRCTIEGCHPNDVGFSRMANVIGNKINEILTKCKNKIKKITISHSSFIYRCSHRFSCLFFE